MIDANIELRIRADIALAIMESSLRKWDVSHGNNSEKFHRHILEASNLITDGLIEKTVRFNQNGK